MLSNIPTYFRMLKDSRFRLFLKKLQDAVPSSRNGSKGKTLGLVKLFLAGERILPFEGNYVAISLLPPLGSASFLQFVRTQGENVFADGSRVRMPAPISLSLAMTNRCNYNCLHCGVNLPSGVREMTASEWVRTTRTLLEMGSAYFALTGGEPLTRGDMEEIVRDGFDERATTILFSNGKVLTRERARSLKRAGLFGLCVSLDSADPEVHNRMRGNASAFEHALTAIANTRASGLYTLAQAVVYKNQLDRKKLFRLFKLARSQGAHEFRIMKPARAGTLISSQEEGIFYDEADDEFARRLQYQANRRWDMPKVTVFPFSEIGKFNCNAGVRHSYITAKGDWTPCDFIPMSFGNVLEEDMRTIWRRMNDAVGVPKKKCWSADLAEHLCGKCLPLEPEASAKIACEFRERELVRIK
ncbi:radical SAM protein [candidate division WOR-3 bacterium]|nr:radical SAM protein [candidate division WOR-3 bacterium]